MKKRGTKMDSLATDVLRQIKRDELKKRIIIFIVSFALLLVTNVFWFIQWNAPPRENDEVSIEFTEEDDDNPQSENEKSE